MSGGFRNRFSNFMSGRYGVDQLGRVLSFATLILLVASFFIRILIIPAMLLMAYQYYRMFSRNYAARNRENEWFCSIFKKNNRTKSDPNFRIFKCPNCSQKIRVPRNKGKICIKCPKCRIEFIKKT